MNEILSNLKVKIHEDLFLKDPQSSALGKKIVSRSLFLINQLGLDQFTFRKLAQDLNTTESSIYRYFESKHKLLLYYYNWYWGLVSYRLAFATNNLSPSLEKLKIAISVFCEDENEFLLEGDCSFRNLKNIVVSESSKAFLTKDVDDENKLGFFLSFKKVAAQMAELISELDNDYPYAKTLAVTCIEGILHQQYFKQHLPSLTDISNSKYDLSEVYLHIISKNLNLAENG